MIKRFAKVLYAASVAIWVLSVVNIVAQPAYAYVDPGSGLLALQIIGSTLAGAMYLVRKRIREVFGFFVKKPKEATKTVEQP
jgi:hypothetical protein